MPKAEVDRSHVGPKMLNFLSQRKKRCSWIFGVHCEEVVHQNLDGFWFPGERPLLLYCSIVIKIIGITGNLQFSKKYISIYIYITIILIILKCGKLCPQFLSLLSLAPMINRAKASISIYLILSLFQFIRRFVFSRYITMHLDIVYI